MGCFVRDGKNGMGCYVRGDKNSMGCFVQGDKNSMGCFVRGGKSLWDVLSGVSENGMGCFVLGCFVQLPREWMYRRTKDTMQIVNIKSSIFVSKITYFLFFLNLSFLLKYYFFSIKYWSFLNLLRS